MIFYRKTLDGRRPKLTAVHCRLRKKRDTLSINIAQQRLLPALDDAGSEPFVVSNEFSCRHQITELSESRPIHVSKALLFFLHRCSL